jgi:hypothetical protein
LDKKYKIEDANMKKYKVEKFMDFNIIDSKTIINQALDILYDIHAKFMSLSESFQMITII